jgi:hypothetical protein
MIHGIYVRSKPKNKWHLVSVAVSPEAATQDVEELQKQAVLTGEEQAEVAIQIFESAFHIPEYLNEVKEQRVLYN